MNRLNIGFCVVLLCFVILNKIIHCFVLLFHIIKHESVLDLFQHLNVQNKSPSELVIDRLNRYHDIFFPDNSINRPQIIEYMDCRNRFTDIANEVSLY